MTRRRGFLIGGTGACAAWLLPLGLEEAPPRRRRRGTVGDIGGATVPLATVSLADFGGLPGAGRAVLAEAFSQAFADLAWRGGGTLLVPAGMYDFGDVTDSAYLVLCRNLRNIAISAYGATFMATTSARVVPNMFYFFNFHNVTLAGASFIDRGFNPCVDWKGMYCVGIQADKPSSGLRLVDCYAERVIGLLGSNNNASSRWYLSDISVQGEVRYAYYGVAARFIRHAVNVDLVCHNVRRALIGFSLRDADIVVTASSSSNWPGSNGLISLATNGSSTGNVENVRLHVTVSGACIHRCYVHFYHVGPEVQGYMRDIDATVHIVTPNSSGTLFLFDHEIDRVQAKTTRTWDRISLHGTVADRFKGKIVSNPSMTTSPGTVFLDRKLANIGKRTVLAANFRIKPS